MDHETRQVLPDFSPELTARYEILGLLGEGGMGTVYRARQVVLDREVALKVLRQLDPAAGERFVREGRLTAFLEHPNILRVYDAGRDRGGRYMVSELLEGRTLRDEVTTGVIPLPRVLALDSRLAAALAHAHAHGVVHRDVKPENVLLTRDGEPRLGDFGLARRREGGARAILPGVIMGTPAYFAPEQISGKDAGPAADQFALAVMAFELLTGQLPWSGEDPIGLALARLSVPARSFSTLRSDPGLVVQRTLERARTRARRSLRGRLGLRPGPRERPRPPGDPAVRDDRPLTGRVRDSGHEGSLARRHLRPARTRPVARSDRGRLCARRPPGHPARPGRHGEDHPRPRPRASRRRRHLVRRPDPGARRGLDGDPGGGRDRGDPGRGSRTRRRAPPGRGDPGRCFTRTPDPGQSGADRASGGRSDRGVAGGR